MAYKLTYFEMRGRAEALRLLFTAAGIPFENNRVSMEQFAAMKPNLPFGELPLLEFDGKVFSQSNAIGRFLSKKFGLHGKTEVESLRIDEILDALTDYFNIYWDRWDMIKGPDPEAVKKFLEVATPKYLTKFNKDLVANGGQYLVGNSLTWADIFMFNVIDYYEYLTKLNLSKEYPALQNLVKTVSSQPKIQEWLAKRPIDDI